MSTGATDAMLLSRFAANRLETTPSKGFTATRDGVISAAVNGSICARLKRVVAYSGELTSKVLMRRSRGHDLAEAFATGPDPVYRISGHGICTWQVPAGKLLEVIQQPYWVHGHAVHVSASIGLAIFPDDGDDPDTLLKNADVAMYRAKDAGKNVYQFFAQEMLSLIHISEPTRPY